MSRRSWSRCWVVALLLLLGPLGAAHAMTLSPSESRPRPCVRTIGQSWEKKSPDGRFKLTLALKPGDALKRAFYELKLLRGTKLLWTMDFKDLVAESYTWLAPDGRAVVVMRPMGELVLVGPEGQLLGTWALRSGVLSKAELARLPRDLCEDMSWADRARFVEDRFELEVPPTLVLGQSLEPPKPPVLRMFLKTPIFRREGKAVDGKDTELIKAFEATQAPEERLLIADELLGRSQLPGHLKGRELHAFWTGLLQTPELSPQLLYRMAVEAVSAYGTDGEVRGLTRLPGVIAERDVAVLEILERRFPEEAGEYALRVLDTRHPAPSVRRRAVGLLMARQGAAQALAQEFALSDSSPEVRRLALSSLFEKPFTAPRFQQVLEFCEDSDLVVQFQVMRFALRTLALVDGPTRKQLVDVLRRSELQFSTGQCSELSLVLGTLTHKEGDLPRALELYARGLQGLKELKEAEPIYPALPLEAALQLALEAQKKGERAEAERYARQVLADPSRRLLVCAPQPMLYEMPGVPGRCQPERKAEQVARELLKRLKSKPRGE